MNLHIEGQNIRFRVSKDELTYLCSNGNISHQIFFSDKKSLQININLAQQNNDLILHYNEGEINLSVSRIGAQNLLDSLPSKEGLKITKNIGKEHNLTIKFEVDIRTQKSSRKQRVGDNG